MTCPNDYQATLIFAVIVMVLIGFLLWKVSR